MTNPLFQPFDLKGLHLPNRIVMAPMTRSFSPGGIPGDNVAAYYRARAEGEVGLIVTEGVGIERAGAVNDPNVPDFFGAALPGWGRVADAVHAAGGRIAPQLWHVGAMPNRASTPKDVISRVAVGRLYGGPRATAWRCPTATSAMPLPRSPAPPAMPSASASTR